MKLNKKVIFLAAILLASPSWSLMPENKELEPAPYSSNDLKTIEKYLLKNISTNSNVFIKQDGDKAIHSIPGAVLASPSNHEENFSQDYQFHWMRDAAITIRQVVKLYAKASGEEKKQLGDLLENYIHLNIKPSNKNQTA